MASSSSSSTLSLYSFLFLFLTLSTSAQPSFRPKSLILPTTKHTPTLQYTTRLLQRTPRVPLTLLLHLGGENLWVDCSSPNYISSTYTPARCRSSLCSLAGSNGCGDCFSPPSPGCNNNTCGVSPENPITRTSTSGELATDVLELNSTDGSNPTRPVSIPRFLFSCAPSFLTRGLAPGSAGVAGLGGTRVALPSQLASAFSFQRKFAICLGSRNGVVFFGTGPYNFLQNVQLTSDSLRYTRLVTNPAATAAGESAGEYYIGVNGINVDGKAVANLNASNLGINDQTGRGGTRLSTVDPYTVMEASIYAAVTAAFVEAAAARNITRRARAVAPFEICYETKGITPTRLGYAVPTVDLVMLNRGSSISLSLFGANTMVQVSDDVACLGFVNGGSGARSAIVVGGYQMEDNLVEFDLAGSRIGFSGSLLGRRTTCANFNFTSAA
ncbi:Probable aspartic proteinase GIP2 [Linum perenne]